MNKICNQNTMSKAPYYRKPINSDTKNYDAYLVDGVKSGQVSPETAKRFKGSTRRPQAKTYGILSIRRQSKTHRDGGNFL